MSFNLFMNDEACEPGIMERDDVNTQDQGCLLFLWVWPLAIAQNTDIGQHFQVGHPALGFHAAVLGAISMFELSGRCPGKAKRVRQRAGS